MDPLYLLHRLDFEGIFLNLYQVSLLGTSISSKLSLDLMFLQIASLVKSVYSRAIRNCSWVGELWSRYLLSLERVSATEDELCKVYLVIMYKFFALHHIYFPVITLSMLSGSFYLRSSNAFKQPLKYALKQHIVLLLL